MSDAWQDRTYILQAVKENGYALQFAFRKDKEIVLEAVKKHGCALQYATTTLKNDREIVLQAVKQDGFALQFADVSLRKDKEIVLQAVKQDGFALQFADLSLRKDRKFILQTLEQSGWAFEYADESLKDKNFILQAVKVNRLVLECVDKSLKKDRIFIYSLFKYNNQYARKFSPDETKLIEQANVSIFTKLNSNIIDEYSKRFKYEKDLYYSIELPNLFKPKSAGLVYDFSPRISYSLTFMEKLIIFHILKQMNYSDLSINNINQIETDNYYLFCFRLYKFLEDNPSQLAPFKELKGLVFEVASKFETLYTNDEILEIMLFLIKWFESSETFDNYKQILFKYNELTGDLSKVFKALNYYYNHFKNNYDFISILGYGGEGCVFKVFHKQSKSLRAIKFKYFPEDSNESGIETINLLVRNDIEGKIKCYESGLIQNHLYSVMEIATESLSNYIKRNSGVYKNNIEKEKLIEILEIFMKILKSVQSIHDHNVLHGDLDPQNIVKIGTDYKIIDFETSRVIKTGKSITIARGKYSYMSPEVSHDNYSDDLLKFGDNEKIEHNVGQITTSCDLFSLGCILLKLLTNSPLQICERFIIDSDISKYNDHYQYFTGYGRYFYTVVTTIEGEMKLHYAIEKLINQSINPKLGVNEILIRSIITMIQRDSTKRLSCYSHILTIENVLKFLQGEITNISMNIEKQVGELKTITTLKNYSLLLEENSNLLEEVEKLSTENKAISKRNKLLEEEIRKLKSSLH